VTGVTVRMRVYDVDDPFDRNNSSSLKKSPSAAAAQQTRRSESADHEYEPVHQRRGKPPQELAKVRPGDSHGRRRNERLRPPPMPVTRASTTRTVRAVLAAAATAATSAGSASRSAEGGCRQVLLRHGSASLGTTPVT
jgi:hypothetical protein